MPPPPTTTLDELLAQAGWVRSLARRLMGDSERGDELAQRTLLVALEGKPQVGTGLRPWLRRVLLRQASHARRGQARRRAREELASRPEVVEVGAAELCEQLEEQQRLAALVAALSEPYRSVVLRRFYRGETVAQIAEETGHSPATVRSQLARGLARLRESLDARARDEGKAANSLLLLAGGTTPTSLIPSAPPLSLLAMKTSTQLAMLAGFALVTVIGLSLLKPSGGDDPVGVPSLGLRAAETQLAGQQEDTELSGEEESPTGTVRTERALPSPDAAVEEASAAAEPLPARLLLRAVDEAGAGLAGVVLQPLRRKTGLDEGDPSQPSDGQGRIEFAIDAGRIRPFINGYLRLHHALRARYRVTAFVPVAPGPGEVVDLGKIELLPGGALSGRVLDQAGMPVAGASVVAMAAVVEKPLEELRLTGPSFDTPRPQVLTDEQGRFELDGLPAGEVRLAAHAKQTLWTFSELQPVEAERTQGGVDLVLDAIPADPSHHGHSAQPRRAARRWSTRGIPLWRVRGGRPAHGLGRSLLVGLYEGWGWSRSPPATRTTCLGAAILRSGIRETVRSSSACAILHRSK